MLVTALAVIVLLPQDSRGGSVGVGKSAQAAWAVAPGVGMPTGDAGVEPAAGTRHAMQFESQARTLAAPSPIPRAAWVRAALSHYGTCTYYNPAQGCDGYLGKRTACGRVVTRRSMFVAALKPHLAKCGLKLTILYRGRKYHTRVQDRGAYRSDLRALDAAPGLRRAMHFRGVVPIRYRKGWV